MELGEAAAGRADRHRDDGAAERDVQLHPQLGEGHRRRLRRHRDAVRVGRGRPGPADVHEGVPGRGHSRRARSPTSCSSHVRYPEDLFKVQREILTRYHVDDPVDFYNAERPLADPGRPDAGTPRRTSRRTTSWPSGRATSEATLPADQRAQRVPAGQPVGVHLGVQRPGRPTARSRCCDCRATRPFRGPRQVQNAFESNNQVRPGPDAVQQRELRSRCSATC